MSQRASLAALGSLLVASLAAHSADAQINDYRASRLRERPEFQSPQSTAFELRFGPYAPKIDDEFDGATPYADVFGTKRRFYIGAEIDWQALRIPLFGTLGPGVAFGYTRFRGRNFLESNPDERADQESTLRILPMYAVAVLRVDVLARETPIPFVPYAKAGIGYALWSTNDGVNVARTEDGVIGKGSSLGPQYALGIMLLLDPLDSNAAREMDLNVGVNNSYLFLEWFNSKLDGLGSTDMNVGTNTWVTGLAFDI